MIELIPMNDQQYAEFYRLSTKDYAAEKVAAGEWSEEEAMDRSAESFRKYLPDGRNTAGAFIYSIFETERQQSVGHAWMNITDTPKGKYAFLYDILIYDGYQNQGYGQQTMKALDEAAIQQGAARIGLHVFGHNQRALHVYQKAGYVITDYQMSKTL